MRGRSSSRPRWCRRLAAVLACVLLAACNGGSPSADEEPAARGGSPPVQLLKGLPVRSKWTLSLAASPDGAIVVNGGVDRRGRPEARLYATVRGAASLIDVPLPLDGPLYDVSTWSTGDEFVIVGLPCPNWVRAERLPDPDLDSLTGFSDACGNNMYSLFAWNPRTQQWRDGGRDVLSTGGGLFVRAHAGRVAVVATATGGLRYERYRLDTATGSATPVPEIVAGLFSEVCVSEDGELRGVVTWDDSDLPSLPGRQVPSRWPEDRIVDTGPGHHLAVVVLDGDEWQPMAVDATSLTTGPKLFTGELYSHGCLGTDDIALSSTAGEAPRALLQVPVLLTFEPDGSARLHIEELTGLPRQRPDDPLFFDFSRSSSHFVARPSPNIGDPPSGDDAVRIWAFERGSWRPYPATWLGTDWHFIITGDFLVSFVDPPNLRSRFSIDVAER